MRTNVEVAILDRSVRSTKAWSLAILRRRYLIGIFIVLAS